MKATKAKKDPVVSDQSGRMMPVDPLGINGSPDEVKRKFDVNASREAVIRQRAYEIYAIPRIAIETYRSSYTMSQQVAKSAGARRQLHTYGLH